MDSSPVTLFASPFLLSFSPSRRLVFPTQTGLTEGSTPMPEVGDKNFSWVHRAINDEQKAAVKDIVNRTHGTVPYVIFGPPGRQTSIIRPCTYVMASIQTHTHPPRMYYLEARE